MCRRDPCRTEEQGHSSLGQARFATLGAPRSTHRLDLYLRCHLPQARQGCRSRGGPPRLAWRIVLAAVVVCLLVFRKRVVDFLWHLLDIYHELKPCRFSFVVAIIGGVVFLWADQGSEVLRALAEKSRQHDPTGATGVWRLLAFGSGLLAWSLASWYSARVLLYFEDPTARTWYPKRGGWWLKVHEWLPQHLPRLLGAIPMWLVGISLLCAHGSYEEDPPRLLLILALLASGAPWSRVRILELRNYGGVDNGQLASGEWWRLFSAPLLHGGPIHIALNGVALFFAGVVLENVIGRAWFAAVFAVSGVALMAFGYVRHRDVDAALSRGEYSGFTERAAIAFSLIGAVLGLATILLVLVHPG